MAWIDTPSETFVARHDARDEEDAIRVLAQLEFARTRLEERFETRPGELAVVLHSSTAQLDAAQPWLPLARRLTAPAARRYVVGWAGPRELHVLCPRLLAHRASNVEGSLETLMLAPSALLARRYGAAAAGQPAAAGAVVALGVARRGRRAVAVRSDAPLAPGDRPPPARGSPAIVSALARGRAPARRVGLRPARTRGGRPRVRHAGARPAP
jgi:hypothetical protein